MNKQYVVAVLLLVSSIAQAYYEAQKDGVSVKMAAYAPEEVVISTNDRNLTASQFTHKNLKPLWIEITNTSDRAIELSKHAINLDLLQKEIVQRPFIYRTILRPFLTWLGIQLTGGFLVNPGSWEGAKLGARLVGLKHEYERDQGLLETDSLAEASRVFLREKTNDPKMTDEQWDIDVWPNSVECKALLSRAQAIDNMGDQINGLVAEITALPAKYKTYIYWWNKISWLNFFATVPHWWLLSQYNKQFELELGKQLLHESVTVAPGQTIKRLLVVDAKINIESFALSIRDPRTQFIKVQFNVIL